MKLEKSEVKQSCKIKSQNVKHRVEIFQKKARDHKIENCHQGLKAYHRRIERF